MDPQTSPHLSVRCTPETHFAKVGETVHFFIDSDTTDPVEITLSLDGSTEKVFKHLSVKTPAEISGTLDGPGFLQCHAVCGDTQLRQAVAFEPEKICYQQEMPEDFEEFWRSIFKESAQLPLDLESEPVKPDEKFESFLLSCANINGQRAYAFYTRPRHISGKVPLLVLFGGGEAFISADVAPAWAEKASGIFNRDMAVLFFHLPPYKPADNDESATLRHNQFLESLGSPRRYIITGMESPRTFYAAPALTGCLRLLEHTAARQEIDREQIFFHGASHGGKFGAYMASFFPFKAVFLGVPSSCEINAFLEGRYPSALKEWFSYPETTQYFDLVYFAPKIKCPVLVSAGFIDRSCPPTGVYSFYNALPEGKKQMFNKIRHGHGDAPPEYESATWQFLKEHCS